MAEGLTDAAKAEIAAAIAIVREDKVFTRITKMTTPAKDPLFDPKPTDPPKDPPKDPDPKDPPKDPVVPPPPKPADPPADPPKEKKRSAYWGEILDE